MSTAPQENGLALDEFNAALRASPGWQSFVQRAGYRLDGSPIKLSGDQRQALKRQLESTGVQFPKGVEIDQAGNVNQDQGASRYWNNPYVKIAIIGGAALATMGAAGFGPLAGAFGTGGAAGAGAGAAAGATTAGATTAGTVGGSTAAVAAGSHWLAPLLTTAIPVAGQVASGLIQAHAMDRGTQAELESSNRALEYQKEQDAYARADTEERKRYSRAQFDTYSAGLQPYRAAGEAALGRSEGALTASRYRPDLGQAGAPASGATVKLADSRGVVRDVPESQAAQFIAQGARRVA